MHARPFLRCRPPPIPSPSPPWMGFPPGACSSSSTPRYNPCPLTFRRMLFHTFCRHIHWSERDFACEKGLLHFSSKVPSRPVFPRMGEALAFVRLDLVQKRVLRGASCRLGGGGCIVSRENICSRHNTDPRTRGQAGRARIYGAESICRWAEMHSTSSPVYLGAPIW